MSSRNRLHHCQVQGRNSKSGDSKNQPQAKEDLMKQEAQVAIQKAKESKLSQQEIVILTENGKALDEKLSDFKNQLDKLTSEFVI